MPPLAPTSDISTESGGLREHVNRSCGHVRMSNLVGHSACASEGTQHLKGAQHHGSSHRVSGVAKSTQQMRTEDPMMGPFPVDQVTAALGKPKAPGPSGSIQRGR